MIDKRQLRVRYHTVRLLAKLEEVKKAMDCIELKGLFDHKNNIEQFEKEVRATIEAMDIQSLKDAPEVPMSKL